ncbi:MAG: hypothetical protein WC749_07270 [Dehalococcoidia bacterium]
MEEPIDVYADQFQISIGPFGCSLDFAISPPTPPAPGKLPEVKRVATIRMSLEHLKAMTFLLRRQIMRAERETGVKIELPIQVINGMGISPDDWSDLWKQS